MWILTAPTCTHTNLSAVTRGINGGKDLPRELLAGLYGAVKRREMRMREGDMYDKPALLPFVSPRLSGWLAKQSTGAIARWKIHWCVTAAYGGGREEGPFTCLSPDHHFISPRLT